MGYPAFQHPSRIAKSSLPFSPSPNHNQTPFAQNTTLHFLIIVVPYAHNTRLSYAHFDSFSSWRCLDFGLLPGVADGLLPTAFYLRSKGRELHRISIV